MKLENVGSSRWGTGCANYWPYFVLLHPLLWLLWAALTQSLSFPSNPELWQTPRQSWGLFQIWLAYPMMHRARRARSRMTRKIGFTTPAEPSRFAS
jgi:hypothetical protein